jgi:hypothetical protein
VPSAYQIALITAARGAELAETCPWVTGCMAQRPGWFRIWSVERIVISSGQPRVAAP